MIIDPLYKAAPNATRLKWDISRAKHAQFEDYCKERNHIPRDIFVQDRPVWLEIGAGSGWFFCELAKARPDRHLIAVERSRLRGQRLVKKAGRAKLSNLAGYRGNAIPLLIHGVPDRALERLYILYPCPWPKNSQRKNRWYLHAVMPHIVRALQPGGQIIWASDQKFYIDEAALVCRDTYGFQVDVHDELKPNAFNDLERFPSGRTKFEATFLASGQPCYELIVTKR